MSFPTAPMRSLLDAAHKAALPENEEEVWALNLDQIESHSGKVLAKAMLNRSEVGPSTYVFNRGTVLYCKLRPYLNKVVVADDDGVATTELVPLRCDESKVLPHYLAHFLRSATFLAFATNVVAGAKMPRMVMSEFWSYPVPLPPLEEQRRIAAILDQAETLRTQRRTALALLDSLTQSIFLDMFGDMRTEPDRWPKAPFEAIVKNSRIGLVRGSQELDDAHPYPYLRMNAITRDGELKLEGALRATATAEELETYRLRHGDFLFNTRNSRELVGKTALFRGDELYLFNNNLLRVRFVESAHPEYVVAAFKTQFIQNELELRKSGTTNVFAVYYKDLRTLPIPLPPLPLQQTFATRIASIEALKATHRRALAALDALFASLQQRAFAGQL